MLTLASFNLCQKCQLCLALLFLLLSLVGKHPAYSLKTEQVRHQPLSLVSMESINHYFQAQYDKEPGTSELDSLLDFRQSIAGPTFSYGPNDTQVLVSLINCEAEARMYYIFLPKENYTIDDYRLIPSIGNKVIVDVDDTNILYSEIRLFGLLAYNVTVDLDFNKWTGNSSFGLQALNATTSEVETSSFTSELLVVGISFFGTDASGSDFLVCGSTYPLFVETTEILVNRNYNLGVFIQYYSGSTSDERLSISPTGIGISVSDLHKQVNYDESCPAVSGTYDGSDVILSTTCALGFSINSVGDSYQGPKFGFDFNPYRNGTFTVSFEWNQLVLGSDLELEGYSTFYEVRLLGEVPPIVTSIAPDGPFQVLGTDKIVVSLDNLPETAAEAELWTYLLSIDFGDEFKTASFEEGSISVLANGTATLIFTLPAGNGKDLPWKFIATTVSSETLEAIDQTSPSYLFDFERELTISTILPSSGTEEGGTNVTLTGEFPSLDGESVAIFFDSTKLDSELITGSGDYKITFTTPSRQSVGTGFQVSVTVVIGNSVSNAVIFIYEPSVILDSLEPSSGPIEGGTEVILKGQFVDFDPSAEDSGIYFGDVRIETGLIASSNSSVIIFRTPPMSYFGNDAAYTYTVSVQLSGVSSNSLPFSYISPLEIYDISPDSGDEGGGTTVVLNGTFSSFNLESSAVYIGGREIDSSSIDYNDTAIVFNTPPRSEIGSAYKWRVWVTVGNLTSNYVYFTYEDVGSGVAIDGSGGSFNSETGYYQLGACADSIYRAVISAGARFQNAAYEWVLTELGSDTDILANQDPAIVGNAAILYIPYEVFWKQNVPYTLTLRVKTDFASFEQKLTIVRLTAQAIGVKIYDPLPRSFSDPNVTLTIPAEIGIPGCHDSTLIINSTSISYEWKFRNATYLFSYENKTAPEEDVSPTLLGREFHIPQMLMAYGRFDLSLTAYFTEQPEVKGSDSTKVVIEPAPLVAQINSGEGSQYVSSDQSIAISASQSRDPDVLDGDGIVGLAFEWTCRYAWDNSMADALSCGDSLLSSSDSTAVEFTLSSNDLKSVYNSSSEVHIEYSLQVKKTSKDASDTDIVRVSELVSATIILSQETEVLFEALKEVVIVNNQSALLDRSNVKYYEDVIITPVSETTETTWSFELLSPATESRTLLSSDENLINLPGFVTAASEAGRLSLGIKANVLQPNTDYMFMISTFRASSTVSFEANKQTITLSTVEQPIVTIGNLATPEGNTTDTYVLSAYTNYVADFKFFFMLTDNFGFESCVGGCQGENVVRFLLATAGSYSVRCDVYDSLGYTLLATDDAGNITVTDATGSDEDLTFFSEDAENAFLAGDHSDFQQLGVDMVKYIWTNNGSSAPDIDSEVLANFTEGMNQIAANAVPNSIQAAGYVRMAGALATLTPDTGITYTTETLYYLVNITVSALERTPDNGALQQLDELLYFYGLSPDLVLETYSTGTSRRRLLSENPSTEVHTIWLDLYEVMKEQIAVTVLKRCSCGCVEEVIIPLESQSKETAARGRRWLGHETRNLSPAASYLNPTQGQLSAAKFVVAHFCNSEQSTPLYLDKDTEKEVRFSWCKEVFENTIKKLYFVLARTPDYVHLSKVHDNVTLSDGLVSTMISVINGNVVENATLPIQDCYSLQMPVLRNLTDNAENFSDDQVPKGLLLAPSREWGSGNDTNSLYRPIFEGIDTMIEDSESTKGSAYTTARLNSSSTGVYTVATRIAWSGAFFSLEGVFLTAAEVAGVVMTIFVLILMASVVAWLVATRWFAAKDAVLPVEADFTYVERDVYGRGTAIDMMEEQEALRKASVALNTNPAVTVE